MLIFVPNKEDYQNGNQLIITHKRMNMDQIGARIAYLYWYDRKNPEPLSLIFKGFLCGFLSAGVLFILWDFFPTYFLWANDGVSVLARIKHAFCSAAFAEETVKLLMLWVLVNKNPYFDE